MNIVNIKEKQNAERQQYLDSILRSTAKKKLIISGPGTGKTYTFKEILKRASGGKNLVMTFINRLVTSMKVDLEAYAEVKTFHAYCKKILHEQIGKIELRSFTSLLIQNDAILLGNQIYNFDSKFQNLEENAPEIKFYLKRGNYYGIVGFNDVIYRLYKMFQDNTDIIPFFDNILIDEFQDFNRLEVAFINELEEKGNILIVGDDDQAVYSERCSSPDFLRDLSDSGRFTFFELPFCTRCTEAIVKAVNAITSKADSFGYMKGRIKKRYDCYMADKEEDNSRYSKIITAQCKTIKTIPKYIKKEILKIPEEDIKESYEEGKEYPTVLIVGQKHYLAEIEKQLKNDFPQLYYSPSEEVSYNITDAYKELLNDSKSNLGWRILIDFYYTNEAKQEIIKETENGTALVDILDPDFINQHLKVIDTINLVINRGILQSNLEAEMKQIMGKDFESIIEYFKPKEDKEDLSINIGMPKILLTSFIGCKGLSAGHVFIVGANNEDIPKDPSRIYDIEISQFLVALTRTRKQCHIISNKWLYSPKDKDNNWIKAKVRSIFLSWIPNDTIEDRGLLASDELE